jgi:hypothetical protein
MEFVCYAPSLIFKGWALCCKEEIVCNYKYYGYEYCGSASIYNIYSLLTFDNFFCILYIIVAADRCNQFFNNLHN